jgi:uncharacterized SAM-binding protein YcdF (DUF218 family)
LKRLVVVLGYSPRRPSGLHPVCAARVARAAALTRPDDVVVLSGTDGEVELMAAAWGPDAHLVRRDRASRTADSAVAAARIAEGLAADEILVVTSWWHRPRAQLLTRAAFPPRGVRVLGSGAGGPWSPWQLVREALCFPLLPLHLALARRRRTG